MVMILCSHIKMANGKEEMIRTGAIMKKKDLKQIIREEIKNLLEARTEPKPNSVWLVAGGNGPAIVAFKGIDKKQRMASGILFGDQPDPKNSSFVDVVSSKDIDYMDAFIPVETVKDKGILDALRLAIKNKKDLKAKTIIAKYLKDNENKVFDM